MNSIKRASLYSSPITLKLSVVSYGSKIMSCMMYKPIKAHEGDVVQINEHISLRFGKVASDLEPIWQEIPPEPGNLVVEEGNFVPVTDDVWFVLENHHWRMMTQNEHVEASRQVFINKAGTGDHFSRP
jgi:hypothetical protein